MIVLFLKLCLYFDFCPDFLSVGHLAHYAELGELPLEAVIPIEKHETLKNILLQKTSEQTYKETLELLLEGYFYNEIRIMQAYLTAELERK